MQSTPLCSFYVFSTKIFCVCLLDDPSIDYYFYVIVLV